MTKTTSTLAWFLRGTAVLALTAAGAAVSAQTTLTGSDAGTGDGEGIENTITVTGTYDGEDYEVTAFQNVDVIASDPSLDVTKTADITSDAAVGDEITYTYVITNDGNVVLTGITLDGQHTTAAGTSALDVLNCSVTTDTTVGTTPDLLNENDTVIVASTGAGVSDSFTSFGPDDVVTCTSTYTVTQADVDGLQATPSSVISPPSGG